LPLQLAMDFHETAKGSFRACVQFHSKCRFDSGRFYSQKIIQYMLLDVNQELSEGGKEDSNKAGGSCRIDIPIGNLFHFG
jgi:hypothetical protein